MDKTKIRIPSNVAEVLGAGKYPVSKDQEQIMLITAMDRAVTRLTNVIDDEFESNMDSIVAALKQFNATVKKLKIKDAIKASDQALKDFDKGYESVLNLLGDLN